MLCGVNRNTVEKSIIQDVKNRLLSSGKFYTEGDNIFSKEEDVQSTLDEVNKIYKSEVVIQNNGVITISPKTELVDNYLDTYKADQEAQKIVADLADIKDIKPTPSYINKVQSFLSSIGVKVENINNINFNGKRLDANGIAIPLQALVAHVEGNYEALTEESFHIAIEILSQTHPGLLNKMLSKISTMDIYNQTYETYKNDPQYQTDGRPDILKIKKEAIAKQLTQQFKQDSEVKNWWQRTVEFFRGLFAKSDIQLSPFQTTLKLIFANKLESVRNSLLQNKSYLVSKGISSDNADRIIDMAKSDMSNDEMRLMMYQLTPSDVYYSISEDTNQTNDKLNKVLPSGLFSNKLEQVSQSLLSNLHDNTTQLFNDTLNKFKNQDSTATKKDILSILNRYIDENGNMRDRPQAKGQTFTDSITYDTLEKLIVDKLNQFPNAKFHIQKEIASTRNGLSQIPDLMIVDGKKLNILNFFITNDDFIPREEVDALNQAIVNSANILRTEYNITSFGEARTIPIAVKDDVLSIDYATDKFIDIPSVLDSTGVKQIDSLIKRLTTLLSQTSRTVSDARLASQIMKAIRSIQIKGDIKPLNLAARSLAGRISNLIKSYNDEFDIDNPSLISDDRVIEMAAQINHLLELSNYFNGEITSALNSAKRQNPTLFSKFENDIQYITRSVANLQGQRSSLQDINKNFSDFYIAQRENIFGIQNSERPIGTISKQFLRLSQSRTKATQTLYRIISRAIHKANIETQKEAPKIEKIREAYDKMFKASNTLKSADYLTYITKKGTNNEYIHQLINKYDFDKFRSDLVVAAKNNDLSFFDKAIDKQEYNKWFQETKKEAFFEIDNTEYHYDENENIKRQDEAKEKWLNTYDISKNISAQNAALKNYISDYYISDEYKEMSKNKAALDLHDYIRSINMKAHAAGAMSREAAEITIPTVEKNVIEKFITGKGDYIKANGLLGGLLRYEDEAAYRNIDPMTGELRQSIPFIYAYDLSTVDKKGNRNYSNISQDIFKILPSYYRYTVKYENLKANESRLKLLGHLEQVKGSKSVDRFNNAKIGEGDVADNTKNYEYYANFLKGNLYGQNDVSDSLDTKLFTFGNKAAKLINKTFGTNLPEVEKEGYVSARGFGDAINKLFQLKVLGLNVSIPIVNFLGSNAQILINENRFGSRADFIKHEFSSMMGRFKSEKDRQLTQGLLEYFQLAYDSESIDHLTRKMSMSKATRRTIPEMLLSFQHWSEIPIQMAVGLMMLENAMIEDGKLVSIREYVKNKYSDIYDLSSTERKELSAKIEREIKELKDTRSIPKIAQIKDDELIIPGLNRDDQSVFDFINLTQDVVKKATGGGNREDKRQINMTFWGRSMMVFHSWIPQLVANRVSGLRYEEASQSYVMGRYNAVAKQVSINILKSAKNLHDIYTLNDNGVKLLKEQYERTKADYFNKLGISEDSEEAKQFEQTLSRSRYIEMHQQLIRSSLYDLLAFSTLGGLFFMFGAMQPPDDDESKGAYNYMYNLTGKLRGELSFYYSPSEWVKLTSGSLFPSLGVVTEGLNIANQIVRTGNYLVTGDEDVKKNTHLFKAIAKPIPIISQAMPLLSVFNQDLADNLGIDIHKQQF